MLGPHVPTDETRERVKMLKTVGNTHEVIAKCLGICDDTLVKYYKHELDTGLAEANEKIAKSLFNKAVDCSDSAAVSAAIFWMKTRARWRTADTETVLESNDALKEELIRLREKLDKQNEKDY